MKKILLNSFNFFKKETVLCIATILAITSSFFVKPSINYLNYIDFRVLAILFCLMLVVSGMQKIGVFKNIGIVLGSKVKSIKGLCFVLTFLCFFLSMLITNDVALITFVPFTITIFKDEKYKDTLLSLIVIETIAANLGSMLTPIGNPQNLYLFSLSNMSVKKFIYIMLPITILSFILIVFLVIIQKNKSFIQNTTPKKQQINKKQLLVYSFLFMVCLFNIAHILSYISVLLIVVIAVFYIDKSLFKNVDYFLLLTFIAFFIFIGNIGSINYIKDFLRYWILGNEFLAGIITSQFISNVPAAMLLSGFTENYVPLLWGVNVGGLGTLIASMASLISYKYYSNISSAKKAKYIIKFCVYNFLLLIILYTFVIIML